MGFSWKRATLAIALGLLLGHTATSAESDGFLQGHLQVINPAEVHLAGAASPAAPDYAKYPLIILTESGKVVTQIIADTRGNYRVALSPGNYILDAKGRTQGHLRVKPRSFTVLARQTTKVDLTIDTGVR